MEFINQLSFRRSCINRILMFFLFCFSTLTLPASAQSISVTDFGNALEFERFDLARIPADIESTSLTVELWVKPKGLSPWDDPFATHRGGLVHYGTRDTMWSLYLQGIYKNRRPSDIWMGTSINSPAFDINENTRTSTGTMRLAINQWQHVAFVYNGTTATLYLNGELDTAVLWDVEILDVPDSFLSLADDFGWGSEYFEGTMDELKIWTAPRTQGEIKADMFTRPLGTEPDLFGFWSFDEERGQIVLDNSDNNRNGWLGATPIGGTDDPIRVKSDLVVPLTTAVSDWHLYY